MKARVKSTGEIIEVMQVYDKGKPSFERLDVLDTKVIRYSIDELNFAETIGLADEEYWEKAEPIDPDYWTRLEHRYAGMAMQGLMSNVEQITPKEGRSFCDEIVDISFKVAHALVEKYKKEEKE